MWPSVIKKKHFFVIRRLTNFLSQDKNKRYNPCMLCYSIFSKKSLLDKHLKVYYNQSIKQSLTVPKEYNSKTLKLVSLLTIKLNLEKLNTFGNMLDTMLVMSGNHLVLEIRSLIGLKSKLFRKIKHYKTVCKLYFVIFLFPLFIFIRKCLEMPWTSAFYSPTAQLINPSCGLFPYSSPLYTRVWSIL